MLLPKNKFCLLFVFFSEMARGSIGRERIISGVVGNQPPNAIQDDLNKELLAVSLNNCMHTY